MNDFRYLVDNFGQAVFRFMLITRMVSTWANPMYTSAQAPGRVSAVCLLVRAPKLREQRPSTPRAEWSEKCAFGRLTAVHPVTAVW
jgi:hypothetical protein